MKPLLLSFRLWRVWIMLSFLVVFCFAFTYLCFQQTIRLQTNIPLIESADNITVSLNNGTMPDAVADNSHIDLSTSISQYVIIYDENGNVLKSTGFLNNEAPKAPIGVLTNSKNLGINKVTWMPQIGVRQAVVVKPFKSTISGYVLVGRSLREQEKIVDMIFLDFVIALVVTEILLLLLALILSNISFVRREVMLNVDPLLVPNPKAVIPLD